MNYLVSYLFNLIIFPGRSSFINQFTSTGDPLEFFQNSSVPQSYAYTFFFVFFAIISTCPKLYPLLFLFALTTISPGFTIDVISSPASIVISSYPRFVQFCFIKSVVFFCLPPNSFLYPYSYKTQETKPLQSI